VPKALLNRDGLDRTGRQTCCQHNLYRNEHFLGIMPKKLKTAPRNNPVSRVETLVSGVRFPA
jgi:hypothetical protein